MERAASASDSSASGSVAPSLPCRCHAAEGGGEQAVSHGSRHHGIHATTTGPLGAGLPARDSSVTSKPSGSALSAELSQGTDVGPGPMLRVPR